jgi:hypothetical protein
MLGSPAARFWLLRGGSWLLAVAAIAVLAWLAVHAWRWIRSVNHAALATAPGGALATVANRTLDFEDRLANLADRLDRLERLNDAREQDDRYQHDGDVVEVLGALLQLNESVRGALGAPWSATSPSPPGAGAHPARDGRAIADKELQ